MSTRPLSHTISSDSACPSPWPLALDLPLDPSRVHGEAHVLRDDVAVDADLTRLGVDREIDGVGVEARRVEGGVHVALDALGVVRRRRSHEGAVGDEAAAGVCETRASSASVTARAAVGREHGAVSQREHALLHPEVPRGERHDLTLQVGHRGPARVADSERGAAALGAEIVRRRERVRGDDVDVGQLDPEILGEHLGRAGQRRGADLGRPVLSATVPSGLTFT